MSNVKPLSLRAYAKRRGVSAEAVSKAITAGRLRESVILIGGAPKIGNPELADREWDANTRPRVDHPPPPSREQSRAAATAALAAGEVPDYNDSRAIREAHAARREAALADMAEIDVSERRGELVSVEDARRDVYDKFTIVKTKLLGVPARLAQRLPELARTVQPLAEELIREALEELAGAASDADGGVSA